MTDPTLPPAITGTEMRLDALIGEIRALRALLTPAAAPSEPVGDDPVRVELREPEPAPPKRRRKDGPSGDV